jgi:hypothetical protein
MMAVPVKAGKAQNEHMLSGMASIADISKPHRLVRVGRVEDGRGSLGHSATPRFPSPLIEPAVPISGALASSLNP